MNFKSSGIHRLELGDTGTQYVFFFLFFFFVDANRQVHGRKFRLTIIQVTQRRSSMTYQHFFKISVRQWHKKFVKVNYSNIVVPTESSLAVVHNHLFISPGWCTLVAYSVIRCT